MSFRMMFLVGLWEFMPLEVMLCNRTCIMEEHVLWVNMFCGWQILKENVYYWKTCLTGKHVLLVGMPYKRACLTREHVLLEDRSYRRTCLTVIIFLLILCLRLFSSKCYGTLAQVNFPSLKMISAIFQPNPFNYLADYCIYIYIYTYTYIYILALLLYDKLFF